METVAVVDERGSECPVVDAIALAGGAGHNTRTDGRLCIRVATLLHFPGIAVGVGEVRETGVVGSIRIGAKAVPATPLSAPDVLVSD